MSFWKKLYKQLLKKEDRSPQELEENKYLKKLKKNSRNINEKNL